MNDQVNDVAFEPMDKSAPVTGAGPRADGTVEYAIVEGDKYIDGVLQPKQGGEIVGYVQIDEDKVGEGH